MESFGESLEQAFVQETAAEAKKLLGCLIQKDQYIGDTWSTDYEKVIVQVNDHFRQRVGGIPNLSFLVASRVTQNQTFEWTHEDTSVLLLRVVGSAQLPGDLERASIRSEAGQRVAGDIDVHWDDSSILDGYTHNVLSFAGIECRVIGTFYIAQETINNAPKLKLKFGTDISNFYPNRGLKVYKPINEALEIIVNYRDGQHSVDHPLADQNVAIGKIRYASTNRITQGVDSVPFYMPPVDLLAQKTALFGMTRTGKSNTTKVIAKSVFELRYLNQDIGRVGQLIFDYNGEYANENVQDQSGLTPTALKNVWMINDGNRNDVVTYGTTRHTNDPERRLMKYNVFGEEPKNWTNQESVYNALQMLIIGKETLSSLLGESRGSKYIANFLDTQLTIPEDIEDRSTSTRYSRAVLAYRCLLIKAGLNPPKHLRPTVKLFNQKLLSAMKDSQDEDYKAKYISAAHTLSNVSKASWGQVAEAMETLELFIRRGKQSGYNDFNDTYVKESSSASSWHDSRLERILGMFQYANGIRLIAKLEPYHEPTLNKDFAELVYDDLKSGKLVIVDQSAGDIIFNKQMADRLMWYIFQGNQKTFVESENPTDILIYIEEAHNLLPSSKEEDYQDIWVRTAKEGAKYRIGLVYATQEVSSIQRNILKNTANWFIAHLNNTDETRELKKFYDFADFERSILRAQDKGFLRIKTLSNLFVVPVQVEKFELPISQTQSHFEKGN